MKNGEKHAEEILEDSTDDPSSIANELGAYLICGVDELDTGNLGLVGHLFARSLASGIHRKVHLWDQE